MTSGAGVPAKADPTSAGLSSSAILEIFAAHFSTDSSVNSPPASQNTKVMLMRYATTKPGTMRSTRLVRISSGARLVALSTIRNPLIKKKPCTAT